MCPVHDPIKSYLGLVACQTVSVPTTLSGYDQRQAAADASHAPSSHIHHNVLLRKMLS